MQTFTPNIEGIFLDLPEAIYRDAPGVSQSTLKDFGRAATPRHYRAAGPKKATPAMEFGAVCHAAILEPQRWHEACHLAKYDSYRTKEAQDWKKEHSDKPILLQQDGKRIPRIVESVHQLPEFASALESGQKEVSYFKRDPETGLLLKCRCDVMATDEAGNTWIFDPKKVQAGCAGHDDFSKQAFDLGYHIQAASYLAITGAIRFIFVPFDDDEPFDCCMFEPDTDMISKGWSEYRSLLTRYAECVQLDQWPGYSKEIEPLRLPKWVK